MRSLRLIGVIAQAEGVRLRAEARAMAQSARVAAAASLFGLIALGLLHAAAWMWLAEDHGPMAATLGLALADAVLMVLILIAFRPRPNRVAQQATELRQQSIAALRSVSPWQEALGLLGWRSPARFIGGRVAEHVWRRASRKDDDEQTRSGSSGRRR